MKDRVKYLFIQYYHNRSSRNELDEFFRIVRSARHDARLSELIKEIYEELKQAEPSLTYINEDGELVLKEPVWYNTENTPGAKIFTLPGKLIAACLAIFLLVGAGLYGLNYYKDNQTTIAVNIQKFTDRGQQMHIILSDSTSITLNASSSITYPEKFTGKIREVTLKGEAFFDVKHADKVPFIIRTGKITTTVLGTAFNIKAYGDLSNFSISVKRGKVSVLSNKKVLTTLIKGESAIIDQSTQLVDNHVVKSTANLNNIGAWQQGYLVFDDETLGDIVSDLERIYNVNITLKNPQLKNVLITSAFKRDIGAAHALSIICDLTDTHLVLNKQQFIIN
jgi:transmembrane sensor